MILAKEAVNLPEETLEESFSKLTPRKSREIEHGEGDNKRKIKFHRLSKKDAEKPLKDHKKKEQKKLDEQAEAARQEIDTKYFDDAGNFVYPKRHSLIFVSASELENGQHYLEWTDGMTGQSATALSNLDFASLKPTITMETEVSHDTILLFHFPYWESSPMKNWSDDVFDEMPLVNFSETRSEFAVVEGSEAAGDMESVVALDALHIAADETPEKVKRDKDEKPSVVKKKPKKKEDVEVYFWPIKSKKHQD
ncbi:MAG: hypothetical protein ACPGN3_17285 [Opitutales bacterium]